MKEDFFPNTIMNAWIIHTPTPPRESDTVASKFRISKSAIKLNYQLRSCDVPTPSDRLHPIVDTASPPPFSLPSCSLYTHHPIFITSSSYRETQIFYVSILLLSTSYFINISYDVILLSSSPVILNFYKHYFAVADNWDVVTHLTK